LKLYVTVNTQTVSLKAESEYKETKVKVINEEKDLLYFRISLAVIFSRIFALQPKWTLKSPNETGNRSSIVLFLKS